MAENQIFYNLSATILPNGILRALRAVDAELTAEFTAMLSSGPYEKEYECWSDGSICYQARERSMEFDDAELGDKVIWFGNINLPEWSITLVNNGATMYHLAFYEEYRREKLMDTFRNSADNYTMIYNRNGMQMFKVQVYKFKEDGYQFVRLQFVWEPVTVDTKPACGIPLADS